MKEVARYTMIMIAVAFSGCQADQPAFTDYPISPVPFTDVQVNDNFWAKRLLTNHQVTIPIAFQKAKETGRLENFKIAGGLKEGKFCSLYPFDDSDVYKNIEAASYSIQLYPDQAMEAYLDSLINDIAAAQEDDGYLYTNRTIDPANTHEMAGKERWVNEEESSHELYNAGHLYEAAVAHYQATGKRTLLDVALKNANLVDSLFGWGKIEKAPGHQEIEIGLVKLYRITGEKKYLDLAKFFLDVRGPGKEPYNQMHKKVLNQDSAVGHAVRAQYMYAAMADIAALTGEKSYLDAIDRLWTDVVSSKTYLTGGIGAAGNIEGFGKPYELPNLEAYCETCASIANTLWNYRMFLIHGDSKYFDVFEKVLYNGLLSGVSMSGDHFFYPNPLASEGQYERKPWFGCACCPVNITRFLPSLPGYIYAIEKNNLYVNLFIGNDANLEISGEKVLISQETEYPWDGEVNIEVGCDKPLEFNLMVRIPGWAENKAFVTDLYYFSDTLKELPELLLNGQMIDYSDSMGYASVRRTWNSGDVLTIRFPMSPRTVRANSRVKEDLGLIAIQRGPIVYCIESEEVNKLNFDRLSIGNDVPLNVVFNGDLLGGLVELEIDSMKAIPYYAWANRGQKKMKVWL